jgi:5-methylcytosine-specific restriction enzyme subunit McrC
LRRARHGLLVEELPDSRARVGPRLGYAGTVLLPSGLRIVVRPKAAIHNLSELLALGFRTMAPPAVSGQAIVEEASPVEWLLLQLADEVHELLRRGLRRGYVERREFLSYLRGRARPALNPVRLPMTDCEYVDFTADTRENQLLRSVLELFAPAARNRHVRRRMTDALAAFGEVSLVRPSLRALEQVTINRLNKHYGPSLRLARLALEGSGVVDAAGADVAPAYFVPLWRVWETAVAAAMRDAGVVQVQEQPEYGDRFLQQAGAPITVTLKPDIVLGPRLNPRLIVDLKWAPAFELRHGKQRLRNAHLYQMATYCSALSCDGLLMYPNMGDDLDSEYEFNSRRIALKTVDLAQPALAALREVCASIAQAEMAASAAVD